MSRERRGIGPVPEGLGEQLTDFLSQLRRGVTDVIAGRMGVGGAGGSGGSGGTTVIGGGTGSGSTEPDLTPPPTPTGVNVVAGIASVVIRTDSPTFTQGHGHLATLVYGKKYGGTGPLPTFSPDAKQFEFSGEIGGFATDPATQWHFWVTWKSRDGVESVAPAGGMNGFQVTTGQDVSLLLDALTGAISESELATSLGNRVDLIDGFGAGSVNSRISVVSSRLNPGGDTYAAIQTEATTRATQTGQLFAQYTVKLDVGGYVSGFGLASSSTSSAFIVRADRFAIAPPSSVTGVGDRYPFIVQATDTTEGGVSIPKGVYMDAAYIINLTATYARFQSLVADDITAMSLFAVSATIGTLKGVYEIRSTTYTSGPSGSGYRLTPTSIELPATAIRGKLTAGQIDGEGLEIKSGGVVLLSSSVNLDASRVNPAAGWLNSNISMSADGSLSGGGGGQVTNLPVPDTRDVNTPPSGYGRIHIKEFKSQVTVGIPGASAGTYCVVETLKGWADSSGGQAMQWAYVDAGTVYKRSAAVDAASWGAWVRDLDRTVYTGDLNATYGAAWGFSLSGIPSNLASLSGAEAIRNSDVTITLNSDGTASVSGGPSAYGGVTAAGLGAVKTDLSNAPSGILNSSITLSGLGARAMAYLDYITAAAASTYIEAASITLAHIKVASISTLSALSSFLGAVEIAVGGYLRSGQTGWGTGSGFWLGWIGSGPGEPGISIGTPTTYLRYRPSTGLEIKLDGMTASMNTSTTYTNVSNGGPRDYGYATTTVSGGTGPYSYSWNIFSATMDNGSGTEGIPDVGMVSVSTNQAYFRGGASNAYVRLAVECVVTDANGRSARAVGNVEVLHGTYMP